MGGRAGAQVTAGEICVKDAQEALMLDRKEQVGARAPRGGAPRGGGGGWRRRRAQALEKYKEAAELYALAGDEEKAAAARDAAAQLAKELGS